MEINSHRWTGIDGTAYEIDARTVGGEWVGIRDGASARPFRAKFRTAGGSLRLVGLLMDDGAPVTARQLREPRVAEVETAFARFLAAEVSAQEGLEAALVDMLDQPPNPDRDEDDLASSLRVAERMGRELNAWTEQLGDAGDLVLDGGRGRGASPPTLQELQAFARVLLDQQQQRRQGAVTRTADAVGMHRSTVHRWIQMCKNRGLLPDDEVRDA